MQERVVTGAGIPSPPPAKVRMVSSESRMDRASSMSDAGFLMLAAGYRFNDSTFLAVHAFVTVNPAL